jgi:hypothetical protein
LKEAAGGAITSGGITVPVEFEDEIPERGHLPGIWSDDGSASVGVHVNALQFFDLCDCDRVSSVSREHRAGCLHILSYKRHHLFALVGIRHVRRDWEIYQPGIREYDDRHAMLNAIQGALQTEALGGPSRILDWTGEVPNGALDRHRLRVGCHLSTLLGRRRADEHNRKAVAKITWNKVERFISLIPQRDGLPQALLGHRGFSPIWNHNVRLGIPQVMSVGESTFPCLLAQVMRPRMLANECPSTRFIYGAEQAGSESQDESP